MEMNVGDRVTIVSGNLSNLARLGRLARLLLLPRAGGSEVNQYHDDYCDQNTWYHVIFACYTWEMEADFDTREDAERAANALRAEFPGLEVWIKRVKGLAK